MIQLLYLTLTIYISVWLLLVTLLFIGFFVTNKLELDNEVYEVINESGRYQYSEVEVLRVYALLRPLVWPFLLYNYFQYKKRFTEVVFKKS